MLHQFLASHRESLLEQSAILSGFHTDRSPEQIASLAQIYIFFDQLIATLQSEDTAHIPVEAPTLAGKKMPSIESRMSASASVHGSDLRTLGFTIEEVVRNYGGLCQAITSAASDIDEPIHAAEFRTMNRCLDDGIAQAVTSFSRLETRQLAGNANAKVVRDHAYLGSLAAMTSHIDAAVLAVAAIRTGRVGMEGATGGVLDRSLTGLQTLIALAVERVNK